ncbi:hypothetical protein BDZ89DRAFT_1223982 [Hymenopellis radicata]|nr:hypothetical protein BDZ89DRAFT_1223982 [Hymenopellis radicata]
MSQKRKNGRKNLYLTSNDKRLMQNSLGIPGQKAVRLFGGLAGPWKKDKADKQGKVPVIEQPAIDIRTIQTGHLLDLRSAFRFRRSDYARKKPNAIQSSHKWRRTQTNPAGLDEMFGKLLGLTIMTEALVGIRSDNEGFKIRVEWADFDEKRRTWEPLKHLCFPDNKDVNDAMLDRMWAHLTERHKITRVVFENGGYDVPMLWVSRRFYRWCCLGCMNHQTHDWQDMGPQTDDNEDIEDAEQKKDQAYPQRYAAWRAINSNSPLSDA